MTNILDMAAVGRKDGTDAQLIVQAYIDTNPSMPQNHTMPPEQQQPVRGGGGGSAVEPKSKD